MQASACSCSRSGAPEREDTCSHRYLTCFTTNRRGCHRPGEPASSARHLWSERLKSGRPSVPLNGAPFWKAAEYTAQLLKPNADKLLGIEAYRPSLAIHLRYGDSCIEVEKARTKRRCGPIEEYVDAAKRLHARYGFRSIGPVNALSNPSASSGVGVRLFSAQGAARIWAATSLRRWV